MNHTCAAHIKMSTALSCTYTPPFFSIPSPPFSLPPPSTGLTCALNGLHVYRCKDQLRESQIALQNVANNVSKAPADDIAVCKQKSDQLQPCKDVLLMFSKLSQAFGRCVAAPHFPAFPCMNTPMHPCSLKCLSTRAPLPAALRKRRCWRLRMHGCSAIRSLWKHSPCSTAQQPP